MRQHCVFLEERLGVGVGGGVTFSTFVVCKYNNCDKMKKLLFFGFCFFFLFCSSSIMSANGGKDRADDAFNATNQCGNKKTTDWEKKNRRLL